MRPNRLLVKYPDGYIVVEDAVDIAARGAVEGFLTLRLETFDAAYAEATSTLAAIADRLTAIVVGVEPTTGDVPYTDFGLGDTVTVPDRDGSPVVQRVVGMSVSEDDQGEVLFAPEINAVVPVAAAETQALLRRIGENFGGAGVGGTVNERAAPITFKDAVFTPDTLVQGAFGSSTGDGGGVAGIFSVDVQTFSTSGSHTWTKPDNALFSEVVVIGAGGGGGGGCRRAAGITRTAGAPGGSGAVSWAKIPASSLGATENLSVGAKGTGGAGAAADNSDGSAGTNGGDSWFGGTSTAPVLAATGGRGGGGGSTSSSTPATAIGSFALSSTDGRPGATSSAGDGGGIGNQRPNRTGLAVSGGSGGGIDGAGNAKTGAGVGWPLAVEPSNPTPTGTPLGSNGANGTELFPNAPYTGGCGAGGGGDDAVTGAGNGGNGIHGSGGGSGGAAANGRIAGSGGAGGDGFVMVVTYCTADGGGGTTQPLGVVFYLDSVVTGISGRDAPVGSVTNLVGLILQLEVAGTSTTTVQVRKNGSVVGSSLSLGSGVHWNGQTMSIACTPDTPSTQGDYWQVEVTAAGTGAAQLTSRLVFQ